ncbi:MAG: hypothetical protein M3414_03890 [Pseudomonadota bacterium]|nr:hypothetical protein [Pseudomonadota bacterium]
MRSDSHDKHDKRPADTGIDDQRMDDIARQLHAGSLAALTPQTLSRLRSARHSSTTPAPSRRWLGWTLAGSSAAVLALAIAVQPQLLPSDAPPQQVANTAPIDELDAAGLGDEYRSLSAGLDENPEFYLWLASNHDTLALNTER